jgi:tetratricopeptide (TPR) repeat protein
MRTKHQAGCVALALLITLAFSPAARADNVAPDCSADPACLNLYERAKAASAAGDPDEALRLYKLAHEVRPDPLLLFSIARILHKQGKTQEAVPYYTRFLAAPTDDPVPRKKAEEYLAQIREGNRPTQAAATPAAATPAAATPAAATPAPIQAPTPTSPTPVESKPVYKKWWFWTLIGVGVAGGVAAGVAVAATSATAGNGLPDGVTTVTWTF